MVKRFLTLHHPADARHYYAQGLWRDDTLYGLLASHAATRPNALALEDGTLSLTWKDLLDWVDGVAVELRTYGLVRGDRVSIWMSNRAHAIVTFLACSREGFACNPSLHRTYTCSEVASLIERLSARALVTEPRWGADWKTANLDATLAEIESLRVVYTPDTFPKSAPNMTAPCADPDKVVYLAFTSGTTGTPKCVMHSDNTLLANARDLARDWGHNAETAILTLSPLSHHIAWVAVAQWVLLGCRLVTDDPPEGVSRVDWIMSKGATYVLGVPTHAMDILNEQRARGIERLGSVKVFYMAGAAIPPSVAAAFVAQGIKPQNVYGMTENSSHHYTHPGDDTETIISTCGRGGKAYDVKIFDTTDPDREVSVGEVGQIGGRGASLTLGYFGNQTATEASFNRDGWFMSGDLGVLDPSGNLRIEGRVKDMIIRGGHNIYPAHIEALALRNELVRKVACFPMKDERLGERVCIAIMGNIESEPLLQHLAAEGLSRYDMPEYFLQVEAFPLTASGKILKRDLVVMVERGELKPAPIRYKIVEEARV
jgi:acyl-CoA synthetase